MEKMQLGIYGIEEYLLYSSEPDKASIRKGYYRRKGIEQLAQEFDALEEAHKELEGLMRRATREGGQEKFVGSIDETSLFDLITTYPKLIATHEFTAIPKEIKIRVLNAIAEKALPSASFGEENPEPPGLEIQQSPEDVNALALAS